jgi:hypothetical protein
MQNATSARYHTAVGFQALQASSSSVPNTAVGIQTLIANTTGSENTAIGGNDAATYNPTLASNTTGTKNTAVGFGALGSNTTASLNTAVGYQAGYTNTTGRNNSLFGYQAGYSMNQTDASEGGNQLFGYAAGQAITSGKYNSFTGYASGYLITTGSKNTIIGTFSGNQGGLDIRTANNHIVLSDGDGNPRGIFDNNGSFFVGKTQEDGTQNGFLATVGTNAYAFITNSTASGNYALGINRQASDGTLIEFRQANTGEGSISVSGTTVSYNGGNLSRWAQTTAPKDESIVKGTVLSNLDEMNVYTKDGQPVANEQLNKVKVSDTEGDVNVAGVFVNWSHDEQHNVDEINMAMTGDMIIRIAQDVTVVRGDLLMSAGDGTAKPQGDDIVRSKTIAKVTSTHVTCTYEDGSFCVPCVLMAC